jgi:muconate cycloisomerase
VTARIATVETFLVRYPVIGKFKFFKSSRNRPTTRDTVLVKITDDGGRIGWGQSVPSPTWSYETPETVRTTIDRYLGPALVGCDAFDMDAIWRVMNQTIAGSFSTGQPICKAGIDLALHDLAGHILKESATERWGRQARSTVSLSWTVDAQNLHEVVDTVAEAHRRGYRNFNVKVGSDAALDVLVCREIRRLAPAAFVWVDANGGYDIDTALSVAPRFADEGVAALEQPLASNRLTAYKRLRRQKALPILLDEPIVSLADLEEFHQLGLLDGVAMKVSRCGGLTESRRIVEYLQEHGLLFFASGLTDPDLALSACLLLFGVYGLERPAALNGPQYLGRSILRSPLKIEGDQAQVPRGYGLGVAVDESQINSTSD